MSEPTTVWAVTDGDYSDFSVVAVFETEAEANVAKNRGMGDSVQEMDYFAAGAKPVKQRRVRFRCLLDPGSGDVKGGTPRDPITSVEDVHGYRGEEWTHPAKRGVTKSVGKCWADGTKWEVVVAGPDNDRTRKVLYDLVAKTRAEILEGHR